MKNKLTKQLEQGLEEVKKNKLLSEFDLEKSLKESDKQCAKWWYPSYWWLRYGFWNWLSEIQYRIPNFFHRAWYGWGKADTWNFNSYLSNVIYEGLVHLKKYKHGCPIVIDRKKRQEEWKDEDYNENEKVWNSIFEEMILAFKLAKDITQGEREFYLPKLGKIKAKEFKCLTKEEDKTMKKGMSLFIKYFFNLWD